MENSTKITSDAKITSDLPRMIRNFFSGNSDSFKIVPKLKYMTPCCDSSKNVLMSFDNGLTGCM